MAQAGPSNPPRRKGGKNVEPKVKAKKVKKMSEAKTIAALEQAALHFVSSRPHKSTCVCSLTQAASV